MSEEEFRLRARLVLGEFDMLAQTAMREVLHGSEQPPLGEPFVIKVDQHFLGVTVKPDYDESGGVQVLPECALPAGMGMDDPDIWDWASEAPYNLSQVMEAELYDWLAIQWNMACDGRPLLAVAIDESPNPAAFDLVTHQWIADPRDPANRIT